MDELYICHTCTSDSFIHITENHVLETKRYDENVDIHPVTCFFYGAANYRKDDSKKMIGCGPVTILFRLSNMPSLIQTMHPFDSGAFNDKYGTHKDITNFTYASPTLDLIKKYIVVFFDDNHKYFMNIPLDLGEIQERFITHEIMSNIHEILKDQNSDYRSSVIELKTDRHIGLSLSEKIVCDYSFASNINNLLGLKKLHNENKIIFYRVEGVSPPPNASKYYDAMRDKVHEIILTNCINNN